MHHLVGIVVIVLIIEIKLLVTGIVFFVFFVLLVQQHLVSLFFGVFHLLDATVGDFAILVVLGNTADRGVFDTSTQPTHVTLGAILSVNIRAVATLIQGANMHGTRLSTHEHCPGACQLLAVLGVHELRALGQCKLITALAFASVITVLVRTHLSAELCADNTGDLGAGVSVHPLD